MIYDGDELLEDWQFKVLKIFNQNSQFKLLRYEKERNDLIRYCLDNGL